MLGLFGAERSCGLEGMKIMINETFHSDNDQAQKTSNVWFLDANKQYKILY